MISGNKREQKQLEFTKKVGLFEGRVIAVNPTAEEFSDKLGIQLKEDSKFAEYLSETDDGKTKLRVDFWLEDVKSLEKFKLSFYLEDKVKTNKDNTKKQYINNISTCSWADDPNNLPSWFAKRDYRVAFVGEEDFYKFVKTWLAIDYTDPDAILQIEWKKLMKGNLSDLKEQVGGNLAVTVGVLATVRTVEKEGETTQRQNIYNKAFLAAYNLKQFRLINYNDPAVIRNLKERSDRKDKNIKPHERFVLDVVGEYGCKDFYVFKDLKEYNPDDDLVASDAVISTDGDDY